METGYVLRLSDRTFGDLVRETVGVDIHSDKYTTRGTSKANKLRAFWDLESDYTVGKLLCALIDYAESLPDMSDPRRLNLARRCRSIAERLVAVDPGLDPLKRHAETLDANHLADQISRLEASVQTDPSLAIGTAKEIIETCCKTILEDTGKRIAAGVQMPRLVKETLDQLELVPKEIQEAPRGAEAVGRLLRGLSLTATSLAELRNLYGTGHGKHGRSRGLDTSHAKLAAHAATAFVEFLLEKHKETTP